MPAGDSDTSSESDEVMGGWGDGSASGEVGKDGSFKFDVAPSAKMYQLVITARISGLEDWFISKIVVAGKDVLESGFKIGEAQSAPIEIVVSDKGATIEGTALDRDKKPFPNAEVIAVPSDPKLRKRFDQIQKTTADQMGHFKLRGVRPGEYIVMSLENPEEQPFLEDVFLTQNSAQAQTVKAEVAVKQQLQLQVISAEQQ